MFICRSREIASFLTTAMHQLRKSPRSGRKPSIFSVSNDWAASGWSQSLTAAGNPWPALRQTSCRNDVDGVKSRGAGSSECSYSRMRRRSTDSLRSQSGNSGSDMLRGSAARVWQL